MTHTMDNDSRNYSSKLGPDRSSRCKLDAVHEYRRGQRIPYCADVELKIGGGLVKATIRNIGSGGFWVDTQANLSVGQRLELDFHFRSGNQYMQLTGRVVRKSSNGFGIEML
jgi:hypothetical protein